MITLRGVVCAALLAACFYSPVAHPLEAGAAKVEIVPAEGVPLDGDFSRRGRPAAGSRDPLHVRALFLQGDTAACFIVVADVFAITPDLRARVLDMAPAVVPRENIVLAATHTLHGPGGLDRSWLGRQRGGRFMPEHVEAVAGKFAEAMQLAYDGRKRAAAGYAGVDSTFAVNRFDPLGAVDGRLSVLRVDDSDGNPIAILANLGVAPQGSRSSSFSAGFPGAFCTALEAMTAAPSVAFFLNGASADQIAAPFDTGQGFAEMLAAQVKAMVNEISCREVTLVVASETVETPRHAAAPSYPAEAALHALELDRFAMIFAPAIPRGAVGSALRKSIANKGYTHSMIVAPANGYLGSIASVDTIGFADQGGEPVYFGPAAAEWLPQQAVSLLSRAAPDATAPADSAPPVFEESNGIVHLSVAGSPGEIGTARGQVLQALKVPSAAAALPGEWLHRAAAPVLGHWRLLRPVISVETMALPIAAEAVRGLLRGLSPETIEQIAGMGRAIDEPFMHFWLRQLAPSSDAAVPVGPVGVVFFLDSSDVGTVIGQTIEWPAEAPAVVSHVRPVRGRAYVIAGLPWQAGGLAGVNDHGLAVAVAPQPRAVHSAVMLPAEALLAEVLSGASSLDDAVAMLSAARPEFSGRVLLVHDDGKTSRTAVVDLGVLPSVTMDMATEIVMRDEAAPSPRELRVRALLNGLSGSTSVEAEKILVDRDRRAAAEDRVLRPSTRAGVVLVPRRHEIRIMAPADGAPRVFEAVAVRGDES